MAINQHVKGRIAAGLLALALLTGCGATPAGRPVLGATRADAYAAQGRSATAITRFMAANMCYRVDPRLRVLLDELDADIVRQDASKPFNPADKAAYAIGLRHARARLEPASLEALLNGYVFGDKEAPLKDLKIGMKNGKLTLAGKLKKGIWLGFEMEGDVSATPDGRVRMVPGVIKSMGIRVDDLMKLVGLDLARLLKARQEKGVVIEGNEIVLDPAKMFPPPKLVGPVVGVKIENGLLALAFRDGAPRPLPAMPVKAPNWIALWGGSVSVNAVVAHDAKIQLVDANPADPFVYALDFYRESLEGGLVVAATDGHLLAYLPDANAWGPNFGRFAPALPVVGIKPPKSDMPPLP